jgi:hypothetical protein
VTTIHNKSREEEDVDTSTVDDFEVKKNPSEWQRLGDQDLRLQLNADDEEQEPTQDQRIVIPKDLYRSREFIFPLNLSKC